MSEPTRSDVLRDLQQVFQSVFNNDQITLSDATTANEIDGWDSLQQIKIILACEKKFGIKLRARDVNVLDSVGSMVDHLLAAIKKSGPR